MKKISEPIVFFGSGPVAAESLRSIQENFIVGAVITKPLPPHHHGQAPVEKLARDLSLKIYYARDKNELQDLFHDDSVLANIRLGILVDFGIIVSQAVIDRFKLGIVNSHFSLLPEWRGADPITFAILSGQSTTGVSLMLIVKAMDEGPLLAQEQLSLSSTVTTPELTSKLIRLSNNMILSYLPLYMLGKLHPIKQNESIAPTYSRKLTKEDGKINWNKGAKQLEREIRAFKGWPRSHATINGIEATLTEAHVIKSSGTPSQAEIINKELVVHCAIDSLVIDHLKPAGKTEMSGPEFLRGHPIK